MATSDGHPQLRLKAADETCGLPDRPADEGPLEPRGVAMPDVLRCAGHLGPHHPNMLVKQRQRFLVNSRARIARLIRLGIKERLNGVARSLGVEPQFLHDPVAKPLHARICLLYTSDAADERSSVDLGGRRI